MRKGDLQWHGKFTIDLTPPTHATYDISNIIVAELILEELLPTFTPRQYKRIIDVLEVLDFKVTIEEVRIA